jgi:hypothetical protein
MIMGILGNLDIKICKTSKLDPKFVLIPNLEFFGYNPEITCLLDTFRNNIIHGYISKHDIRNIYSYLKVL